MSRHTIGLDSDHEEQKRTKDQNIFVSSVSFVVFQPIGGCYFQPICDEPLFCPNHGHFEV